MTTLTQLQSMFYTKNSDLNTAISELKAHKDMHPEFDTYFDKQGFLDCCAKYKEWQTTQIMLIREIAVKIEALQTQVELKKDELNTKADILGKPVDYNVKYITERESQLAKLVAEQGLINKDTHPEPVIKAIMQYNQYETYELGYCNYCDKLEVLEHKVTELQRDTGYISLVIEEETWRPKYEEYAAKYSLAVDYDNMFDVCALHYLESFVGGRYGLPCECGKPEDMEACVCIPTEDFDNGRYMDHYWVPTSETCNRGTKILPKSGKVGTYQYPIGLISYEEPWVLMTGKQC